MAAVITSTDTPEATQAALAGKYKTEIRDISGNPTGNTEKEAEPKKEGAEDAAPEGEEENAVPPEGEGENASESETEGNDEEESEDDKGDTKSSKLIKKLLKKVDSLEEKLQSRGEPAKDDKKTDAAPPEEVKDEAEPKAEDFDTQADFTKAHAKWNRDQIKRELKADAAKETAKAAATKVLENWEGQVKAAKTKYKDFDTVMGDTIIGKPMAKALVESPDGVELAYYIGKNPERAKDLKDLKSDREIGIAIGELRSEVRALNKSKEKPKSANDSSKPKPITPVTGHGKGAVEKPVKDMSYQEYKVYHAKKQKQSA